MRIWSLHPKHLDAKGLVALWRETLLAKKVLEGHTRGYTNHPQLWRFKQTENPLAAIHSYLSAVFEESCTRGYCFDGTKFDRNQKAQIIPVTTGQVAYEIEHLLRKLQVRDPMRYETAITLPEMDLHPLFTLVTGDVEHWEIIF